MLLFNFRLHKGGAFKRVERLFKKLIFYKISTSKSESRSKHGSLASSTLIPKFLKMHSFLTWIVHDGQLIFKNRCTSFTGLSLQWIWFNGPVTANFFFCSISFTLFSTCILNCKLSLDLQNYVRPSVLPSVPLYLLQFLSDSFNIAHMASLQCRGRHGWNFFFFSGHVSGHFRAVKKGLKI